MPKTSQRERSPPPLAIIYYMIYIPYWLSMQGIKFVVYAALLFFAFQILMHTFE